MFQLLLLPSLLLMTSSYSFMITKMINIRLQRSNYSKIQAISYEAELNPQALEGLVGSIVFLVAAQRIWWNDIIPQKRTELAKSKANGEVKELLDDIKASDENDMQLERWFFNDWLKKEKKSVAIPFIKNVKWNSGDNPVLVAFAGIISCVVTASLAERATTLIP